MLIMMFFSFASTSSNVQLSLSLFWDISSADVATPPAFAALPGAKITLFACRYCVASRVVGMLAPSHTAMVPFATSCFASSRCSSFWVAHGSARSALICHTPLPSWYSAFVRTFTYSVSLALFTSLISFSSSTSIPSGSYTQPVESEQVRTFTPSSCAFWIA